MNAYDESYLDDAMKNLGEAFDYATNACKIDADVFAQLFIASGVADFFGKGNPKYISGMSGTELAIHVFKSTGANYIIRGAQAEYECSAEYWAGWILAYYQWKSRRSFKDILDIISIKEILRVYPTLHEASEEKFYDTVESIALRKSTTSKLQRQRKIYGYSQRELAEKSGVNLRTLQQYEIGAKDISKASASTVIALTQNLGCRIEDII